jgi:hypothetical protein
MIRTKVSRRLGLAGFDPAGKFGYANRQKRIGSREPVWPTAAL